SWPRCSLSLCTTTSSSEALARDKHKDPLGGGPSPQGTTPDFWSLPEKTFVIAHHQLRFELLHRVERHADDDQDRGATEEEVGAGLVDEHRGQRRDRREEKCA